MIDPAHDLSNICFVCGHDRQDFSKKGINFDKHTHQDHDPWKYIYFIFYLKSKGEDELSGLEYHAWTGYLKKEANWAPVGYTRYLEEESSEQLRKIEDKIENIEQSMYALREESGEAAKYLSLVCNNLAAQGHLATSPRPV